MPNWQPNWDNVRWDFGAADDAVAALRRAADRLDQSADERLRAAQDATREWRGAHRARFDGDLERLVRRSRDLAQQYREAASNIANRSRQAYEEQQRRERDRERWEREKREEEERERREREQREAEERARRQGWPWS